MPVTDAPATEATPTADAADQPTQYQPYQPYQGYTYVKPRNPRKGGPILFWFTLALIAAGVGTLGIIDVSGTVGARRGLPRARAGPHRRDAAPRRLLGPGRRADLPRPRCRPWRRWAPPRADNFEGDKVTYVPTSSAQVRQLLRHGRRRADPRPVRVDDIEGLDGDDLEIDGGDRRDRGDRPRRHGRQRRRQRRSR